MKLTRQDMLRIAQQEFQNLLKEIKFKPSKMSKHALGTQMGSKENPCRKPGGGNYSTGNRLFDPHVNPGSKEEWECNTAIEDALHNAINHFISANSVKQIEGRIGDFIIKHFDDMTDSKLPLHRYTQSTPLYRGSGRIFNQYGLEFLKQVNWSKGVEDGGGITRFPFNGVYKLRRPVSSFTDDFNSAVNFMKSNDDKDCIFLYETKGNNPTAGGGFFLDLKGMYDLRDNPHYKMSKDGSIEFFDVRSFANESEVLLIGAAPGDHIEIDWVFIDTDHLNNRMGRLKQIDAELYNTIRNSINYSEKNIKQALRSLKNDQDFIKKAYETYIPKLKAENNLEKIDRLIYRIERRTELYLKKEEFFGAIGKESEYKTFMAAMGKLYKDLQSLKPAPKEWGAKSFDQ